MRHVKIEKIHKPIFLATPEYQYNQHTFVMMVNDKPVSLKLIEDLYKKYPNGFTIQLDGARLGRKRKERIESILKVNNIPHRITPTSLEINP